MYELIQAGGSSYYIQSPAKIGLVRLNEKEVCLIDSGSDRDAGRKTRQILDANGWILKAVFNTHSHADHIGGNGYLQSRTGCKIYSPGIECDFTRHPVLEPAFIYGGFPPKELRHKFLLAQESDAEFLTAECMPEGLELIPLPGHSFDMVGYKSADGTVYLADCLSSEETLDKYGISFIYDVEAYINTLERVKALGGKIFVPAHAEATDNIAPLAQLNIDRVYEAADRIVEICTKPLCFERILQELFRAYGLTMTVEQYALVGSTVRSYLSWLKGAGRIDVRAEDGLLLWEQK